MSKPAALDGFGRLRVSNPQALFDAKQVFGDNQLLMLTDVSGGGSVSYQAARSSSYLTVPAAAPAKAIRQSRQYFNYQPGKGQQILVTFVLGAAVAGLRRRVGYFDSNNGIFLEQYGANVSLVIRSDVSGVVVDTPVAQSAWSITSLPSLDLSKAQVMFIDFEWLGVGTARVGFVTDAGVMYVHQFPERQPRDLRVHAHPKPACALGDRARLERRRAQHPGVDLLHGCIRGRSADLG